MKKLSKNFSLIELTKTSVGKYAEENSMPPSDVENALEQLCVQLLQPIRDTFGSVVVNSGYRCPSLNTAIGGSKTSQHLKGEAADIYVPGYTLQEIFKWIVNSELNYGQVILEASSKSRAPSWIHISLGEGYRPKNKCKQILIFDGEKYIYKNKEDIK